MTGQKDVRNVGVRGAILALVTAAIVGGLMLPACAAQPQSAAQGVESGGAVNGGSVVAKVAGETVNLAELEKEAADQLEQLETQYQAQRHQLLEGVLLQLVQDRIIAAEAKERGMTTEELIAAEVESKITEVTDADVDAFYEENRARIPQPKEQVAPRIKQYLASQRQSETYGAFVSGLEKKYQVAMLLEPPRREVAAEGPSKGPADAPVTIVEFSDFECPFCSRVVPTLEQVRANYADKVRLVFRQFPLAIHPNAQKAAEASLCADEQGKFWEMHDKMFAQQQALAVEGLKSKAAEIGLDAEKFNQCLDSGRHAERVQADMQAGTRAGVSGTPAMFVNGIFISGAVPYEEIAKVVDAELARKSSATAN